MLRTTDGIQSEFLQSDLRAIKSMVCCGRHKAQISISFLYNLCTDWKRGCASDAANKPNSVAMVPSGGMGQNFNKVL